MAQSGIITMSRGASRQITLVTIVYLVTMVITTEGFYLRGSKNGYASFPTWNACPNASFSFEFQTTQSSGMLMYADDGGTYDFFEVLHSQGRVKASINIVDGQERTVVIEVGRNVNDGRWHRLTLQRNRMETTLIVDNYQHSQFAFGSDFHFGSPETNSPVYFGGIPEYMEADLTQFAVPSVIYEPNFKGSIRNVLYGNCSCSSVRGEMLASHAVSRTPPEACETHNPCVDGCVCISQDEGPSCDCNESPCQPGER